ncbi:hypothetical protein [Lacrimispora sp. JR3]|uniref:hypothetical protein n=1 Tax=Lacrimispora sinapis TaxID=3111456 RepID=UPI003749CC13
MDNNLYEYEIDLKDLIFAVFRRWRLILLAAFAMSFMLGGYKCVKEFLNQKDDEYVSELKKEYENDLEQYEQTLKGYERDIDIFTDSIDYQEKYKENSILLKTDPYNKGFASADVFVKMSEMPKTAGTVVTTVDLADGVVKAYASAIQQGGALESLSHDMGIDIIYLKELVQVTTDYDSNMLNISVTYPDEKGAKKILSKITDSIDSMYSEIQTNLGSHSVIIMNQNVGVITDQTLADYQKQKVDDLAETNTKLKDTEKALEELEEPMKPVALSKMSIIKAGIKFGILGWLAGAFISACVVCAIFLLNGKIGADDDLKNRFGLKFLGGFSERRKKRAFSGIDDWLDSVEGKESVPDESIYDMIAANIHIYNNTGQSVFVTGTVEEEVLNNFVINLQRKLPDLVLGFGADMNKNVFTLQKVYEYDQVVLLEERKRSRLRAVEKEVETVLNMNKVILGYVILDAHNK